MEYIKDNMCTIATPVIWGHPDKPVYSRTEEQAIRIVYQDVGIMDSVDQIAEGRYSRKILLNSTRRAAYAVRLVHINPGLHSIPLNVIPRIGRDSC